MRVLVTGACGLLGAHLLERLSRFHEAVGTDRHSWWGDLPRPVIRGDLLDPAFRKELIRSAHPQVVFHCAALTDVDACERDPGAARAANTELPQSLVSLLPPGCRFVHLSTDAVFGGACPMASEKEIPAPVNAYGRSKWEGEKAVLAERPDSLVVRTNFYGWSSGRKKTFAEWLWQALERQEPVTLFTDFFFSPIYAADLAERLELFMERGCRGLVHLAGRDRVSKSQFGLQMAQATGFSPKNVKSGPLKDSGFAALRGGDLSLDSTLFCRLTPGDLPSCEEGLHRFVQDRERSLSQRFASADVSGLHR